MKRKTGFRRLRIAVFLILPLALLAAAGNMPAFGQTGEQERFSVSLERAESYLNHGQYEEAILLLEKLQRERPRDGEVRRLLLRGYERSKNYGKLLDLLLAGLPKSATYAEDVGRIADCWFKLDQVEPAESTLATLLNPPPEDPEYYNQAAMAYLRNGRYQQAVEIYKTARERFQQPRLFSLQLADLYESRREYANAIMEYFWDVQENPRSLNIVQRKIAAIVRMEGGTTELTAALKEIVVAHPGNFHAHRLYAELLLESGDPESAWPEYLQADMLAENPGEHVLYYITRCLEDGHFSSARRACQVFVERYPDHQRVFDVRMYTAQAMAGLNRPDSAIALLREIATGFPSFPLKSEIFLEIANLYLDRLHLPDSAEVFFRRVIALDNDRASVFKAVVRLGDCMVIRDDLTAADSIYASCLVSRPGEDQREYVMFKRAELLFFAQAFDSVSPALKAVIREYPNGYYVNDAIILSMRVDENREPFDWSLKKFAAASLMQRQRRYDQARIQLGELARDSASSLADDALFELGRLYSEVGRPDSAVAMYRILTERYPEGYLAPAALTALAAVYANGLEQAASARACYHRVLTEYADSPYLEEARRRLQALDVP